MHTYRYKAVKSQSIMFLAFAVTGFAGGIWLLSGDFVLAFGRGDNAPTLGLSASKVVWAVGFVAVSVGLAVAGLRALVNADQEIEVSTGAVTVPKGELSNKMVTFDKAQITSLALYGAPPLQAFRIVTSAGSPRVFSSRFDSVSAFHAFVRDVEALAGVPVIVAKG